MWLLFLDEFGNPGLSGEELASYHPAFGYAGILVNVRDFDRLSQAFLTLKSVAVIDGDTPHHSPERGLVNLKRLGHKKLTKLIREINAKTILQNRLLEEGNPHYLKTQAHSHTVRMINILKRNDSEIFLFGIEKSLVPKQENGKNTRMMLHLLSELTDRVAAEARKRQDEIMIFFDRHSQDKERLETIEKRIFARKYFRFIRKAPSFCDSEWSQGVQFADWICNLMGKVIGQYCATPRGNHKPYFDEYMERLQPLFSEHSAFRCSNNGDVTWYKKPPVQMKLPLPSEKGDEDINLTVD